ncbi:hypothetical protein DFH08DRAFT_724166, partial [Mycena albidolilacea]
GTYRDAGYGVLELCLVNLSPEDRIASASASKSMSYSHALPGILDPHIPTFVARWKRYGGRRVTHVSFAHFKHNLFNVTGLLSIPTENSSDKPYWVQSETYPDFVAEFSLEDRKSRIGVGLQGFWGAGEGIKSPRGESVKDRAEVWFEKIKGEDDF